MSTKKLSPRQKMISMMYLVLTAMLAMNVSKEVLNAFVVVNEGIENSNSIVNKKNIELYEQISKLKQDGDSLSFAKIKTLVEETQHLTQQSIAYIEAIKDEIKETSGQETLENGEVLFAKLDDQETATRILTQADLNQVSKGELLRQKLEHIYDGYLDIIDRGNPTIKNTAAYTNYKSIYSRTLSLQPSSEYSISKDGEKITWVDKNFYNVPVIASDVILSKLQNDIYGAEAEVLSFLKSQIGAELPTFDQLSAAVLAPKSYLPAGKTFTADIFIAASSSQQKSEVFIGKLDKSKFTKDGNNQIQKTNTKTKDLFFIGDYKKVPTVNGKAKFEQVASGVGTKRYEGIIRVAKPTGDYELYPFEIDYEVAPKSGFSVAPEALNVLYIGLDNPLSVTVSDSRPADVSLVTSLGTVSSKNGKWYAKIAKEGDVNIDVYGIIDGEKKKVGTQVFRAKRVPKPVATLDGLSYDANISLAKLKSHRAVVPFLYDFVYDVSFELISYDFILKNKASEVNKSLGNRGNYFNDKTKRLIKKCKSGDMVFFQNIVVKGPDGRKRKLKPIILNVN